MSVSRRLAANTGKTAEQRRQPWQANIPNAVVMTFFCTLSLLALGQTLGAWRGSPGVAVIGWLTAAIGFLVAAVCARPAPEEEERARKALPLLLAVVLGTFAAGQMLAESYQYRSDAALSLLAIGLVLLYAFRRGVPSLRECRTRVLPVVMLGFLALGVWTIRNNPSPHIDVFQFQQAASKSMVHFQNPFTVSIPVTYEPGSLPYIPLTKNGRTLYGLAYPPLIGILNMPAFLMTGDVRYGELLALLLSCGLIALMQASWKALCAAVLLLINPFSVAMVEYAWVEPMLILIFCLTLFSVVRYPKAVPYLFGLFLCAKQTNLAILPLGWMLADDAAGRKGLLAFFAKSLGVFVAVNLPFYLWNPDAFVRSLVTVQLLAPMRPDLISYAGYAAARKWFILPAWVAFLYLPIGLYLGLRKAPRTAAGFAAASALTFLPFVALSKQGAPNYYFFGIGMLCCALALSDGVKDSPGGAGLTSSGLSRSTV